jgi:hypothetical protein
MLPEILAAEPAQALTLSAVFGFGFAGNMTWMSLFVRQAVRAVLVRRWASP